MSWPRARRLEESPILLALPVLSMPGCFRRSPPCSARSDASMRRSSAMSSCELARGDLGHCHGGVGRLRREQETAGRARFGIPDIDLFGVEEVATGVIDTRELVHFALGPALRPHAADLEAQRVALVAQSA